MSLQRLQFEVPEDKAKEIETMMAETGIKTNKELVSNALALFLWSVREVKRGRMIASVDEANGKYKEIRMPAFEFVTSLIRPAETFADLVKSDS